MNFLELVAQSGSEIAIESRAHVFRQGDDDDALYYVRSGFLKAYYVSLAGKESIKSFIRAGNIIGSLSAIYRGLPCAFSLIALQDCRLLKLNFNSLQSILKEHPEVASQLINVLIENSMKKEQREFQFLAMPSEERYRNLVDTDPELLELVTQNDIARYLGITPVALSRIRKRLQLMTDN